MNGLSFARVGYSFWDLGGLPTLAEPQRNPSLVLGILGWGPQNSPRALPYPTQPAIARRYSS